MTGVTKAEAIQRIKDGLGFRRANMDAIIVKRMQEAMRDMEAGKTLPDFLRVFAGPIVFNQGASSAFVPADFIREDDNAPPFFYADNNTSAKQSFLTKASYVDAYSLYWKGRAQAPSVYTTIRPLPSQAWSFSVINPVDRNYTIYFSYYVHDTDIALVDVNKWLLYAPEWLIGETGVRMAADRRDVDAVSLFGDMLKKARSATLGETLMNETPLGPIAMGGG